MGPTKAQQRLHEQIRALQDRIACGTRCWADELPPFGCVNVPRAQSIAVLRADELRCRAAVDAAVEHWIERDAWQKVRTTERYWLGCRFEHAAWLALCLLVPEPDGRSRYLPVRAGALPPGLLFWLLVPTWAESGVDRFLHDCGKEQ